MGTHVISGAASGIGRATASLLREQGHRVIGVDPVAERRHMAARHGVEVMDMQGWGGREVPELLREATGGRGPDGVVDAVGMEAHGSPVAKAAHQAVGILPGPESLRVWWRL